MWLITTLIAAVSLRLWGASVMILTDHIIGYESGEFIQMTTEGMITSGTVLGIAMLIPIFIIWEISVIFSMKRGGK